jgi:uncharacterized protein
MARVAARSGRPDYGETDKEMKRAFQFVLRAYQRLISPLLPPACRYVPTCSEYAIEAIERHGAVRGSLKAAWRLLRCNPFAGSGYDPVERCSHIVVNSESAADSYKRPQLTVKSFNA